MLGSYNRAVAKNKAGQYVVLNKRLVTTADGSKKLLKSAEVTHLPHHYLLPFPLLS
jgi:hypothetical protein